MRYQVIAVILLAVLTFRCQQQEAPDPSFTFTKQATPDRLPASKVVNLHNKGVGPIDSVFLSPRVDPNLAGQGKALYGKKCNACHKVGTTFIGPPPNGILERRTPEWVMNMIMNPEEMLQKDSLAQALFMEFNGQLMTNQNVSEDEARAILEYFRTLDAE